MSPSQTSIDANDESALSSEDETPSLLEDAAVAAADMESEPEDSIEQQLEKAQETIKDYWDQVIRVRAEMENNRKRADRDIENAHKYALKNFIEDLLPIVDSMEMGQVAALADNATLESICEGSALTTSMFMQVLGKHGLQPIEPLGERFDPERHQAISMLEQEGTESNTVIEVMQKGFILNERLVRPAMVVVSK